jgi:hypothetical protein
MENHQMTNNENPGMANNQQRQVCYRTSTEYLKDELAELKTMGIAWTNFTEVKLMVDNQSVMGMITTFRLQRKPYTPGIEVAVYPKYLKHGVAKFEVIADTPSNYSQEFKSCVSRNLKKFVDDNAVFDVSFLVQMWARVIHALEDKIQTRLATRAPQQGTHIFLTISSYYSQLSTSQ